ncbi:MAG: hypothetical protein JWM11_7596 [Planctomycetaceae bacterium]|nr:hypothetical protein [Planctomycetaceae bacterium]
MLENSISEQELREALRPYQVDPNAFAAGIRQRLETAQTQRASDPMAGFSPFLRSAAACLPLAIFSGCRATPAVAKIVPTGVAFKLLGWFAFPAISLFLLLGATVFSVAKIRSIRDGKATSLDDQEQTQQIVRQWWREHWWGAAGLLTVTIALTIYGATWLLFLMYILSFGVLIYVLSSLARLGLGDRQMVGRSCIVGLSFLGQLAGFAGVGNQDIHFVDQSLLVVVFYAGVMLLIGALFYLSQFDKVKRTTGPQWMSAGLATSVIIPLSAWLLIPSLCSPGPSQIKRFVESFHSAPYQMVSWQQWEIPAKWTLDLNLDPDLTIPRGLLDSEISGDQNPYILGTALRVGLLPTNRLSELRDYQLSRKSLLTRIPNLPEPLPITFLQGADWVIRAAVLRGELSSAERDLLERTLHVTLGKTLSQQTEPLESILRLTQLLEVIGRPVNRDRYRDRIHDWLRLFHTHQSGGFQLGGGFKTYPNLGTSWWHQTPGDLVPTSYAVELMQIYGIPEGIDPNWIRSFLKPTVLRFSNDKWIAAASLGRLNQLPDIRPVTWVELLYYERSLFAASILVGLCLYATLSPQLEAFDRTIEPSDEST